MELMQAIYGRHSVRTYSERSVPKDVVMTLLRAAVRAPSALNAQPWAFVVVQDKAMLKRYSDRAKVLFREQMGTKLGNEELRSHLRQPEYNVFYNAGTLVELCAKPQGTYPAWDCCFAAENLMLAAHDIGLGTCVIGLSWPLFEEEDVRRELSVPTGFHPVLPIIVGYPVGATEAPPRKEPEIVCWR